MVISLPAIRDIGQRPHPPFDLDRGSSLATGLTSFIDERVGVDLHAGHPVTIAGTRTLPQHQLGLTRGFGPTYGSGTSDRMVTRPIADEIRSWSMWYIRRDQGGTDLGALALHYNAADSTAVQYMLYFGGQIHFFRQWSGSSFGRASWRFGSGNDILTLYHIVVTYDSSSTSNDPSLFVNGVPTSMTEVDAPSGTVVSTGGSMYIGNSAALSRHWGGYIGPTATWNRLLTEAEAVSLYRNPWSLYRVPGRRLFFDLGAAPSGGNRRRRFFMAA